MFIEVKTLLKKSIPLQVEPFHTAAEIIDMLEMRLNRWLKADQMRLILKGKCFYDDMTLERMGAKPGCVVHLVWRLYSRQSGG